jgi:hypothetical protein
VFAVVWLIILVFAVVWLIMTTCTVVWFMMAVSILISLLVTVFVLSGCPVERRRREFSPFDGCVFGDNLVESPAACVRVGTGGNVDGSRFDCEIPVAVAHSVPDLGCCRRCCVGRKPHSEGRHTGHFHDDHDVCFEQDVTRFERFRASDDDTEFSPSVGCGTKPGAPPLGVVDLQVFERSPITVTITGCR